MSRIENRGAITQYFRYFTAIGACALALMPTSCAGRTNAEDNVISLPAGMDNYRDKGTFRSPKNYEVRERKIKFDSIEDAQQAECPEAADDSEWIWPSSDGAAWFTCSTEEPGDRTVEYSRIEHREN